MILTEAINAFWILKRANYFHKRNQTMQTHVKLETISNDKYNYPLSNKNTQTHNWDITKHKQRE